MIQKLLLVSTILLALVCVSVAADEVSGKWSMSQKASNGGPPRVTVFDLKVDGMNLTGTVTAPMGGRAGGPGPSSTPIAIAGGKVNGGVINFDVTRTFAGYPVKTKYECTVSGDTMHVKQTIDSGNGPQTVEADAKRMTP